jgi:hypothetical protein
LNNVPPEAVLVFKAKRTGQGKETKKYLEVTMTSSNVPFRDTLFFDAVRTDQIFDFINFTENYSIILGDTKKITFLMNFLETINLFENKVMKIEIERLEDSKVRMAFFLKDGKSIRFPTLQENNVDNFSEKYESFFVNLDNISKLIKSNRSANNLLFSFNSVDFQMFMTFTYFNPDLTNADIINPYEAITYASIELLEPEDKF